MSKNKYVIKDDSGQVRATLVNRTNQENFDSEVDRMVDNMNRFANGKNIFHKE